MQTVLSMIGVYSVTVEVNLLKKRGTCTKWNDKDRFKIQVKFSWDGKEYHLLFHNKDSMGDKRCFKGTARGYTIGAKVLEIRLIPYAR